jgi:hypothetical protein
MIIIKIIITVIIADLLHNTQQDCVTYKTTKNANYKILEKCGTSIKTVKSVRDENQLRTAEKMFLEQFRLRNTISARAAATEKSAWLPTVVRLRVKSNVAVFAE